MRNQLGWWCASCGFLSLRFQWTRNAAVKAADELIKFCLLKNSERYSFPSRFHWLLTCLYSGPSAGVYSSRAGGDDDDDRACLPQDGETRLAIATKNESIKWRAAFLLYAHNIGSRKGFGFGVLSSLSLSRRLGVDVVATKNNEPWDWETLLEIKMLFWGERYKTKWKLRMNANPAESEAINV